MKSEHRHELETNALAKRLGVVVEKLRPYAPAVLGIVGVAIVGMIALSYINGASAARQRMRPSSILNCDSADAHYDSRVNS